jgi:integrase
MFRNTLFDSGLGDMKQNTYFVSPKGTPMRTDGIRNGRGRKYLNLRERIAFYECAQKLPDPQAALCLVLFFTGCRISEALNLTAGQLDREESVITFETLKQRRSGVYRSMFVPQQVFRVIPKSPPERKIWTFSRTTAWRIVKSVMTKANILGQYACPRGLRHGFGVDCALDNVKLDTIQGWLGHAEIATTTIYTRVMTNEERQLASHLWRHFDLDKIGQNPSLESETK